MKLTLDQGKKLIKLARSSISSYFENKTIEDKEFTEKRGVFVTLHTLDNELRGCIGFPSPIYPLGKAVIEAAKHSAFSDTRFEPLKKDELNEIIIEISVLTKPLLIKVKNPKDYIKNIEIGKHGLIIEVKPFSGLLLPQVALENKFTVEQFLDCLCRKAGLLEENWKQPGCKIYKFEAQIFLEQTPNGTVIEK